MSARVILIAGLGFGDEGKGSVVDYLVRRYGVKLVVRYNGGAQAAHSVVLEDGRHHTFSQFGSGTFLPGCRTHLSRCMLVQPGCLLAEAAHLETVGVTDAFDRLTIEGAALITTRFHAAINRLREMSRDKDGGRHGSCGLGIGETVVDFLKLCGDTLFASDILDAQLLREKLRQLQIENRGKARRIIKDIPNGPAKDVEWEWLCDPKYVEDEAQTCEAILQRGVEIVTPAWLEQELNEPGTVLFEGAQGVLLDQYKGFMPYCTRSAITFNYTRQLLTNHTGPVTKMGIIRSYFTRHGAGPMPTQDDSLQEGRLEAHNCWGAWQQDFRLGHFDMVLFRYALEAIGGVDEIVVTHMDKKPDPQNVCVAYDGGTLTTKNVRGIAQPLKEEDQWQTATFLEGATPIYEPTDDLVGAIEAASGTPVTLLSYGPTAKDKLPQEGLRTKKVSHA